jgi:hypothetical protein
MLEGGLINVGDYIDVVRATPRDGLNTSVKLFIAIVPLKTIQQFVYIVFFFSQSGIPAFALLNFP